MGVSYGILTPVLLKRYTLPGVNAADVFFRFLIEHIQTLSICSVLMLILMCNCTEDNYSFFRIVNLVQIALLDSVTTLS